VWRRCMRPHLHWHHRELWGSCRKVGFCTSSIDIPSNCNYPPRAATDWIRSNFSDCFCRQPNHLITGGCVSHANTFTTVGFESIDSELIIDLSIPLCFDVILQSLFSAFDNKIHHGLSQLCPYKRTIAFHVHPFTDKRSIFIWHIGFLTKRLKIKL